MAVLSLDWLSFTYKPNYDEIGFKNVLDCFIHEFPELRDVITCQCVNIGGRMHYNTCLKFNDDFMFMYNNVTEENKFSIENLKNIGLNVSIPSHSIELFFKFFDIDITVSGALWKMLRILENRHCQLSRIDLCFDDYEKKFTAKWYAQKWLDGYFATNFRYAQNVGSDKGGYTFYLGSLKKRDKILRIYDKYLQTSGEVDCVRYEFELHAENARDCMKFLLENGEVSFADYITSWFRILKRNDYQNTTTGLIDEDWLEWLEESVFSEEIGKFKIPHYDPIQRGKHIVKWIENQVLPSLKGYAAVFGWDWVIKHCEKMEMSPSFVAYISSLDFDMHDFVDSHGDCPFL